MLNKAAGLALSASLMAITAASAAQATDLTVVGWGGTWNDAYVEGVWNPYTAETGNKVIAESWDGSVAKIRAQVQSGNVIYDVVSITAPALEIGCAEGLFKPLTEDITGPRDAYLPGTVAECGVASDTWAIILAYSKDAIKGEGPKSWADYYDTEKFPGKRGMLQRAQYTLENALVGDGVAPEDVYDVLRTPEGIDRAFAKMDSIRDDIVWWSASAQGLQNLASGDIVMSDFWNARITNEIESEGRNYAIVWDAGFFYGTDHWAVVEGGPNEDASIDLIKWFSIPENQAGFSKLYAYGTGRVEAANFIPEEQLVNLPTAPKYEGFRTVTGDDFWVENKEVLEARFQTWLAQ